MGRTRCDLLLLDVFLEALAQQDLAAVLAHRAVVHQQEVRVVTVQHHIVRLRRRHSVVRRHALRKT